MEGAGAAVATSRLRRLASRSSEAMAPEERCELCGQPIAEFHRHVLNVQTGELMCTCRACSTLFDGAAAGGGHFKLIPDRRLRLTRFELPDPVWEQLRIPVDIAYFFRSTREERVKAFYPSPVGPTESLLGLEAWDALEDANPVLRELRDDVEALLVNRARGPRRQWIVPIEDCFSLVAAIRTRWRGFSGGPEVWQEIDRFFDQLDSRSRPWSGKELTWQR
jgi:hypothetical protein